ncbi:myb dna-binding domain-containing protein [Diaporthe amygdali]|uniref:myb dna-binding domain-containing protein n=1 Tax=Phomopsis amygdali TaxID=1214568 RepID=UPI0022FE7496|nr:myb dna-binding domain-containing protein [Diaporthe amygdali]KAJ0123193.1 myb dna-binding domain-containing protein [Diaporthe amygdali]
MATIEPRLMHLLNDSNSPETSNYPPPDLPPIQSFSSFAKSSNFSLPPLEPDASQHGRSDKSTSRAPQHIPPLASITEEYNGRYPESGGLRHTGGGISLRMLYDNPDVNDSQLSLSHILDEVPEPPLSTDDASTKKRQRAVTIKDDIMHLPQPLKKQKSAQNIVPPIINGLYEPPPNAAVFPPIALEDNENASNIHPIKEFTTNVMPNVEQDASERAAPPAQQDQTATPEADKASAKVKRKAAKPRRKWSEEETRDLLLGVNKYGVGKWTSILDDPVYNFNGRTAGDLKDRFRTCCPDELRVSHSKSKESLNQEACASAPPAEPKLKSKTKTALLLEDILADPEEPQASSWEKENDQCAPSSQAQSAQQDSDSTTKPKKSRAHRKKLEDLQKMGIHGPFKKSHRRERRPFTQQDDDQILEGLQMYGPAWTKIQRDPRFDLSSRQPTDLRDRVRNKYPDTYKQIEERQIQAKETAPGPSRARSNVMEPSVNTMVNENSLMTLEPHLNRSGSREDMMVHKWSGTATLPSHSSAVNNNPNELPGLDSYARDPTLDGDGTDAGEQAGSSAFIGNLEAMDISRLLLD